MNNSFKNADFFKDKGKLTKAQKKGALLDRLHNQKLDASEQIEETINVPQNTPKNLEMNHHYTILKDVRGKLHLNKGISVGDTKSEQQTLEDRMGVNLVGYVHIISGSRRIEKMNDQGLKETFESLKDEFQYFPKQIKGYPRIKSEKKPTVRPSKGRPY